VTTKELDEIERQLKHIASEQCRGLAMDGVTPFFTSELAIRLLLANLTNAPVDIFERARQEHRNAEHGGDNGGENCHACGYIEAALYQAKTGRSLSLDFLGREP
jgi:hypothetical protein